MNVEILIVVDPSVYENHKIFLNSTDDKHVFDNIRKYYAHTINGVNDKFYNSFKNDSDLTIGIQLAHVLILTVKFLFHKKNNHKKF